MRTIHPRELRETARVVGIGLLTVAAVDFAGNWLHERSIAACAVQVAIAELGAGRLAIAWSPPSSGEPTIGQIGRRIGRGAMFGFAAAIVLLAVGAIARTLSMRAGSFEVASLLTGLLVAALSAVRDELLLRGIVLRALQSFTRGPLLVAACAAAAVARVWFAEGTTPESAIVSGAAAAALACIWLVDRGAWMAVGANAAFLFCANTMMRGPIDVRGGDPPWGGGALGLASGRTSAIAMSFVSAAAVIWWRRRQKE